MASGTKPGDGSGSATTDRHRLLTDLPAQPVVVRADRARILMVITNLLDNAIKYSPGGGEVSCMVGSKGQTALVAVSDEGLGIAAEDQPALMLRSIGHHTAVLAAIEARDGPRASRLARESLYAYYAEHVRPVDREIMANLVLEEKILVAIF